MSQIIVQIRKIENAKSLKALTDLTISLEEGDFTVRRVRVIHKEGKSPWVAFPQESAYRDGQPEYFPIFEISRKLRKLIEDKILEEYGKL